MRSRSLSAPLYLVLAASLSACGGSEPAPAAGGGGAAGGPKPLGAKTLGRKMPEFTPSGMKEEYKKFQEVKSAVSHSKKREEQDAAKKALAEYVDGFPARWEGKEVPAPEAFMYSVILQECKKYPEAVTQVKRWIEVAPEDNVNYVNAHKALINCLGLAGDYDGAKVELEKIRDTVFKNREGDLKSTQETIANSMLKGGRVDLAAVYFDEISTGAFPDDANAVIAVDCWQRLGKPEEAVRLANRVADLLKEGRSGERAKQLVLQVALLGKPAPGFSAVKYWKGSGGVVTDKDLKGKVTLVFVWNMKSQLITWFFERMNKMIEGLADKPFQVVGISRLAKFDAVKMATRADMTDEQELEFYDMWAAQYKVTYPLAVGGYQDDALINAWAGYVVPGIILVGKDGNVCYVGSGKDEERFGPLREMIDKALAK